MLGKLHAYTGAAQAELGRWESSLESAARAAEIIASAAGERSKHVQNAFVTLDRAYTALTGVPLPPAQSVTEGVAIGRKWRSVLPKASDTASTSATATPSPEASAA